MVASVTPTLLGDLSRNGWTLSPLGAGYARAPFAAAEAGASRGTPRAQGREATLLRAPRASAMAPLALATAPAVSSGPCCVAPKTDFVFQRIFGSEEHKPALIGFLNDILELEEEHRVADVAYLPPEQRPKVSELKSSVVDVECIDRRGGPLRGRDAGAQRRGVRKACRVQRRQGVHQSAGHGRGVSRAQRRDREQQELPGFEELFKKSIEKVLRSMPLEERFSGLTPEERLAGLAPEERLAGLAPEQVLLGLPIEVLRGLDEDHLRSLPVELQETIRRRLRGEAH